MSPLPDALRALVEEKGVAMPVYGLTETSTRHDPATIAATLRAVASMLEGPGRMGTLLHWARLLHTWADRIERGET